LARTSSTAGVAARQLSHLAVEVGLDAEPRAVLLDALLGSAARQPLQVGLEQQVAPDAEVEIEGDLLEHHADVPQRRGRCMALRVPRHLDLAFVGGEQAGQHLEQRRLAGAVGAQQRDELARLDMQRQRLQRGARAVSFGELMGAQHGARVFMLRRIAPTRGTT
jgi:hypothetical protein